MDVGILFQYMRFCTNNEIEPSFQGLKEHKHLVKDTVFKL